MSINLARMRWIDNYVGKPICYFLELYVWVKQLLPGKKEKPIETILIAKYLGMGSIVLATPLIRSIKNKYPKAKLIFLTFHENEGLIKSLGLIDEVMVIKTGNLPVFLLGVMGALYRLRKKKIDVVLNLEFFSKFGTVMGFLSGAYTTASYYLREPWRSNLISHKVYYNHYKHISEVFCALGDTIGAGSESRFLEKPAINSQDKDYIRNIFEKHGLMRNHWKVVVNINTSALSFNRCWPILNFTVLTERIVKAFDAKIILIGAESDMQRVDEFSAAVGNSHNLINLAGKTSIVQLLALLESVDLVITNDSGPLHLAVMMGTPTISFFGPESPVQYGPRGEKHTVIYKSYYCSPCLHVYNEKSSSCKDNSCLKDITVEEVFEVVAKYRKSREQASDGQN